MLPKIAGVLIAFGIVGNLAAMDRVEPDKPGFEPVLQKIAESLPSSAAFESDKFGSILVVPAEALLGVMAKSIGHEETPVASDVLVFHTADIDRQLFATVMRELPEDYVPIDASIWLCAISSSDEQNLPRFESPGDSGLQFVASRLAPSGMRLTPTSPPVKRTEGPGNLKRRGDWFRSNPKQQ